MFKKLFGFGKAKDEAKEEIRDEVKDEVLADEDINKSQKKIEFLDDEDISSLDDRDFIDGNVLKDESFKEEKEEKTQDLDEEVSKENLDELSKTIDLDIVDLDGDKFEEDQDLDETELLENIVKETIIDMSDVIEVINLSESDDESLDELEMDEVTFNIRDCELVKVQSDEEDAKEAEEAEEVPKKKISFFEKLKSGLTKTSKAITDKIDDLLTNYGEIDEDLFEELEEILITADIGMSTTMGIIDELRKELQIKKITESSQVKQALHDVLVRILSENNNSDLISSTPSIILVIGVNGAGKTTTIGKIANQFKNEGKSVMLAAGDTFRAAAIDQLQVWGERAGVPVIAQQEGSDPAAVIFDAVQAAKSRKTDVLICDTAGRLHNKVNLMNELNKVFKVVEREFPNANKEVLLVLDATTGQNAINQAKTFREAADITGIVLTKLDGTAKGGVILGINSELNIPVKLIGVGEGVEDLQKFNPVSFVDALLNMES